MNYKVWITVDLAPESVTNREIEIRMISFLNGSNAEVIYDFLITTRS